MERITNSLSWFEIPVLHFERARAFYSRIFDYEMPVLTMGPNRMGILPYTEGRGVGGAIVQGVGYVPSRQGTLVYLSAGEDLAPVLDRIPPAGGSVLVGKTQVSPELGVFALFLDTEGNRVGLHSAR